jgi:hypothetical protein
MRRFIFKSHKRGVELQLKVSPPKKEEEKKTKNLQVQKRRGAVGRRLRPTHGEEERAVHQGGRRWREGGPSDVEAEGGRQLWDKKKLRFVFYGQHVGLTPSGRETVAKRGGERGWRQAELVVVEEVEL